MYLRRLKKVVAHWDGDAVIELRPGDRGTIVVVRRKGHKGGVQISIRELLAAGDTIRRPKGWIPKIGEKVFVTPGEIGRRRRRATVAAVIERATDLLIKIRYSARGRERFVSYDRLVPIDGALLVQCERIPKDGTTESERSLFSAQ